MFYGRHAVVIYMDTLLGELTLHLLRQCIFPNQFMLMIVSLIDLQQKMVHFISVIANNLSDC